VCVVCVFARHGDDGMHRGLNTATLTVSWRLQHVTEIHSFNDVVCKPCSAMLKPDVKRTITLVSLSHWGLNCVLRAVE